MQRSLSSTRPATFLAACVAGCLATLSFSAITHAQEATSPTIATVNGAAITEQERAAHIEQFKARGQQASEEQVLDELITLELMRQEAISKGLDKSPVVEAEMKTMHARVLANALLNDVTENVDTSDEALKAEYDRQIAQTKVEEYNASHILLEDEARAKEIILELDGGADFAEAAKKYSTGPSGESGGELGWFDAGTMVPEFSAATAELEVGKYSATPVKTQFGYHIIKLSDKRAKDPQPFDTVKDQLRGMVVNNAVADYIEGLQSAADVQRK